MSLPALLGFMVYTQFSNKFDPTFGTHPCFGTTHSMPKKSENLNIWKSGKLDIWESKQTLEKSRLKTLHAKHVGKVLLDATFDIFP